MPMAVSSKPAGGSARRCWIPTVVVLLIVAAAAGGAIYYLSTRDDDDSPSQSSQQGPGNDSAAQGGSPGLAARAPGATAPLPAPLAAPPPPLGSTPPPTASPSFIPRETIEPIYRWNVTAERSGAGAAAFPLDDAFPYPFVTLLGDALLFFEAQRSGAISSAPGGNRIPWRGDQLLEDGADVGMDLSGGHYEAGNRIKVTLASGYAAARLAWSCIYYEDIWARYTYGGEPLLAWCKREVAWFVDWLLRAHDTPSPRAPVWRDGDRLAFQVALVPDDWECFQRAEAMPSKACPVSGRGTSIANATWPAADAAASAAAALAAGAVLLSDDMPAAAADAMVAARALLDFAEKYPRTASSWSQQAFKTYPTESALQFVGFGAAMIAWACAGADHPVGCTPAMAESYKVQAQGLWDATDVANRRAYLVSNWANPVWDMGVLMTMLEGSTVNKYGASLAVFVDAYARADGGQNITATPKGLRSIEGEDWATLRLGTFGAFTALMYSHVPDVPPETKRAAACLARAQLGYVLGDTGFSYVVGHGDAFPQQVHHRDAACTMEEDAMRLCAGGYGIKKKMFDVDRPNPYVLTGAIVGGPDKKDVFMDVRKEFTFTEVALDYNAGLTGALAAALAAPLDVWSAEDCADFVGNYPWESARTVARR